MNKTIGESRALAAQLDKTLVRANNYRPLPPSVAAAPVRQIPELNFDVEGVLVRVIYASGGKAFCYDRQGFVLFCFAD